MFNDAISNSRLHSVERQNDKQIMKWKEYISSWCLINPLEPELSAQLTLQKTQDLNGHPLFCKFLADDFSERSIFSVSNCTLITIDFQHQRVNLLPWHMPGGPEESKEKPQSVSQPRSKPDTSKMKFRSVASWDNSLSNFYDLISFNITTYLLQIDSPCWQYISLS